MNLPKPQMTQERVNAVLAANGVEEPVAILGVRAYWRDSRGVRGVNDVGIYDDAIFVRTPAGVLNCNANTDPTIIGWNSSLRKPFAMLAPGVWPFIRGKHRGEYEALRQPYEEQAEALGLPGHGHFTVIRDNGKGVRYEEDGYFAINIHRGGLAGTSSWGCQTLPPGEWPGFIGRVYEGMKATGQKVVRYCLVNGPLV